MKPILIRYGSSVDLIVQDETATSATLSVGYEGMEPEITKTANFVSGSADLSLTGAETEVPLGSYKYMITVDFGGGRILKFPEPKLCNVELPDFIVYEALDETEVS